MINTKIVGWLLCLSGYEKGEGLFDALLKTFYHKLLYANPQELTYKSYLF